MKTKTIDNQNKKTLIIGALVAALTPVVGALIILISQGILFEGVSVASSLWNDELLYYKQIEAIVNCGLPQGFFGYNESTAVFGTFGAWPAINYLPFVLIGKIIGWHYYTPFIVNVIAWGLAFMLTNIMLRPDAKTQMIMSITWLSFALNVRYIFSCTPESVVSALLLIYAAAFYKSLYFFQNKKWFVILNVIMVYLTLSRGYYGILAIPIGYLLIKNRVSKKKIVIFLAFVLLTVIGFLFLYKMCSSPYFKTGVSNTPLLKRVIQLLLSGTLESLGYIKMSLIRVPLAEATRGAWYLYYLLLGIIVFLLGRKNRLGQTLLLSWCVLLGSMYILYNAKEGSRQLMAVATVGFIILAYMYGKKLWLIIVVVLSVWLTWFSKDNYYMPIQEPDIKQLNVISEAQKDLTEIIELDDNRWDNTIIWTLSALFRDVYAIPAGMGINCCEDDWVIENIDSIKSKYIITRENEDINGFIEEKGFELIYSYGETNIYKLR